MSLTSFSECLHGPVEVGHIFVVSGKTANDAKYIEINLAVEKIGEAEADIPFHFSVRLPDNNIRRNSFVDKQWGVEEVEENLTSSLMPFSAGSKFKVYILVGDEKFHVSINEKPFCTYKYRLPLNLIRVIHVGRDVEKISQVDHRRVFPSLWPFVQDNKKGRYNSFDVPRQFFLGHVIVIKAIPRGSHTGRFSINLTDELSQRHMLHFDSRFNERCFVLNSMSEDLEWHGEERHPLVLAVDQMFKIAIAITNTSFIVAFEGRRLFSYSHRDNISFLENMMGPRIAEDDGAQLEVLEINHLNMGTSKCEGFESYTSLE